ncbi:MAG: hypothetical protein M1829_004158 [Trizodia sp. TS-e1964]|nr:MAG: hypothetical protein M1829_004158 [Trizodia sp. TS-e1964]
MDSIRLLAVRDSSGNDAVALSPTVVNLLIALLVLVFVGIVVAGGLYIFKHARKSPKEAGLPMYNDKPSRSNHRRLTITTRGGGRKDSIFVYSEKQNLIQNSSSPPLSPDSIPEIRITFPEEEDESGRRKSGRVVVVRVGDYGVGMEPLKEENLPPYQKSDADRFDSLDLARIGGLKERQDQWR